MMDVDYTIGFFDPDTGKYHREFGEQGWYFKDIKAFNEKSSKICYIPELNEYHYNYYDFIKIAKNNEILARILFEMVDWQSPELLFNDLLYSGEINENGELLIYNG